MQGLDSEGAAVRSLSLVAEIMSQRHAPEVFNKQKVYYIEKRALEKLRRKLARRLGETS